MSKTAVLDTVMNNISFPSPVMDEVEEEDANMTDNSRQSFRVNDQDSEKLNIIRNGGTERSDSSRIISDYSSFNNAAYSLRVPE